MKTETTMSHQLPLSLTLHPCLLALAVALALLVAACSGKGSDSSGSDTTVSTSAPAASATTLPSLVGPPDPADVAEAALLRTESLPAGWDLRDH